MLYHLWYRQLSCLSFSVRTVFFIQANRVASVLYTAVLAFWPHCSRMSLYVMLSIVTG